MVGFVTVALVAIVLYQWVLVESERRVAAPATALNPQQVLAAYASTPKQDVPIDARDPRLGPADAPVRLVVFSSFVWQGRSPLINQPGSGIGLDTCGQPALKGPALALRTLCGSYVPAPWQRVHAWWRCRLICRLSPKNDDTQRR